MARDVAQRDLDQAGFRIANLGNPTQAGDATKTDNSSVPRSNAGTGSPGTSLLAAAADHVHPASGQAVVGSVQLDDIGQQSVAAGVEEVVAEFVVDFDEVDALSMEVSFAALVKASPEGRFRVRIGGTPGNPDGTSVADF